MLAEEEHTQQYYENGVTIDYPAQRAEHRAACLRDVLRVLERPQPLAETGSNG